ncbi:MAG: V-type ATP synthase subunit F [Firmicutes bacterium]|nr:V-type ATP synthase subunit F [Bacillota bacterium]MCL2771697.1 V-type ATP synthase subunit F [Bacillota bacterium]
MISNNKLAAVGSKDTVMIFKTIGFNAFYTDDKERVREIIKELIKQEYQIVLITESLAKANDDLLHENKENPYPIFLPIPDGLDGQKKTGRLDKKDYNYAKFKVLDGIEKVVGSSEFIFKDKK